MNAMDQPNIIILLADDLGYGDLSCQGGKIPTPHMDKLAAEGARFTDAHASSALCSPSRYSLLTGRYNWRSRLKTKVLGSFDYPLIDSGRETIASFLKGHGYQTSCVGKWHLGLDWAARSRSDSAGGGFADPGNIDYSRPFRGGPLELGFDQFFGIAGSLNMPPFCFIEGNRTIGIPDIPVGERTEAFVEGLPEGFMVEDWDFRGVDLRHTQEAESRIRNRDREKPFFLYFAPSAPHSPWLPPEMVEGQSGAGPRADLVCLLDWMVGRLVHALKSEGIEDETLLIITSDNGALNPEIEVESKGHYSNGKLRGNKSHIFEGGHRVPFLARWPGVIPEETECDELICLMDIFATLGDIIGNPIPEKAAEDSVSFLPLLRNPKDSGPVRQLLVNHSGLGRFAIREENWKLIDALDHGGFGLDEWSQPDPGGPGGMLFDLERDLEETDNEWQRQGERVPRLLQLLQSIQNGEATETAGG